MSQMQTVLIEQISLIPSCSFTACAQSTQIQIQIPTNAISPQEVYAYFQKQYAAKQLSQKVEELLSELGT